MADMRRFDDFIKALPDLELVQLQHVLREDPEDHEYLNAVLRELGERQKRKPG